MHVPYPSFIASRRRAEFERALILERQREVSPKVRRHIEQSLTGLAVVKVAHEFPKTVEVDSKVLDGYTGQYQLAPNFILTVTWEGVHMITQAIGQ